MNEQQAIEQLQAEGFAKVFAVPIEPHFAPGEHTHDVHTAHIMLAGELTIIDATGSRTIKMGDRIDFPAGTTHDVKGGPEAGRMVVGMMS